MTVFRVGLTQWYANRDVGRNLDLALRAIEECAAGGAQLVLLPENGLMLGSNSEMRAAAFAPGDVAMTRLAEAAGRHGVTVILGGAKYRTGDGVHNAALVFGPDGAVAGHYNKIHLFDARIDGTSFEASRVENAGNQPVLLDQSGVRIGLTICYDVRFPELYRVLALAGAEIILVPAAFTRTTGRAHWELLLRARAVESAAFVVASATVHGDGSEPEAFETYGHALVAGPWGEILEDLGEAPFATRVVDLDLAEVDAVRERLPVLRGVRPDAYHERAEVITINPDSE